MAVRATSLCSQQSARGSAKQWGASTYEQALRALDADSSTGLTLFAVDLYTMDDPDAFYPTIVGSMKHERRHPLIALPDAAFVVDALIAPKADTQARGARRPLRNAPAPGAQERFTPRQAMGNACGIVSSRAEDFSTVCR